MIPHNIPDHLWQCIATYIFDVDGHTYLLTVDNYSKYPLLPLLIGATPLDANMLSPTELMFGRTINKFTPHRSRAGPAIQREWLYYKQQGMNTYHDKSSRKTDLSPMFIGQKVRILDSVNKTWYPAIITKKCDKSS